MRIVGLEALRDTFKAAPARMREELKPVVDLRAQKIRLSAQQRCPVRTGRLRDSLRSTTYATKGGVLGRVVTDVPYARHVEFGTADFGAQQFMRPASESNRDPWVRDMRAFGKTIERVLTSGGGLL